MAGNTYQLVIDAVYKGRDAFSKAAADVKKLNDDATTGPQKAQAAFGSLSRTMVAFGGVVAAAGLAAKQLYGTLREGAVLQTTEQRFEKLAASIGSTADTMLDKLRDATHGMISDIDLMASASQIMNLKLATSEDQVLRLATVAGTLNWDMSQVVLTFANMSTMRLDSLGLSVDDVRKKADELKASGMSAEMAFKEAVILAGEAKLDVGGVSESEQAFKQLEAAITNSKNELSLMAIELANAAGLIQEMGRAAGTLTLINQVKQLREEGRLTWEQMDQLLFLIMNAGPEAAAAFLAASGGMIDGITAVDNALLYNQNAWSAWAIGVQVASSNAAGAAAVNMDAIIAEVAAADAVLMQTVANYQANQALIKGNRLEWMVRAAQARARQADAAGPFAHLRAGATEATRAVGGYTAAVNEADAAHQRMSDSFSSFVDQLKARDEAMAKGGDMSGFEDMLIDANGLVNINAANKALYEQAKAAGASAGELALLGVATGQLTEEQAKAALKAAILMEKVKQLAASVVSGDISIGDAVGSLGEFGQQMNEGAITGAAGGLEGLAQAAQAFAEGEYTAEMQADGRQAFQVFESMDEWLKRVTGTFYTNVVVTASGDALEEDEEDTERTGGRPRVVPFVAPSTERSWGGSSTVDTATGRAALESRGGSTYSVVVHNYIDGKQAGRQSLDDVTADKTRAALMSIGLLKQ